MTKVIFLVDMQSFYASVEKADHPTLMKRPVIVSGDPKRRSGIILAACPIAKSFGVRTTEALWEAKQKCPQAVVLRPHMQRYIDVSLSITSIFEQFTDLVEIYSIDEQFLDVTGSTRLFGEPKSIAKQIQKMIFDEIGVHARIGIGPNKILAKMACDHFAKKRESGIFELNHTNMQRYLWPLPIKKLFGVGSRMEYNLRSMGIRKIGHLANFSLDILKKRWGINGEVLWQTANGIDYSPVTVQKDQKQKAIGHHMTLPYDYGTRKEILVILLELSEEVARRTRAKQVMGNTLSIGVQGADFDSPTGFYRQVKLPFPTNFGMDIFRAALELFDQYWDGLPIRGTSITLSNLQSAHQYQIDLFGDLVKKERLSEAMDAMYSKYGSTAIIRASSLTNAGQVFVRSQKIGGHDK
ncbi:DNA polymerase IV [Terrilactibacillus sp. BCM23-1]|uniref:DNA polymerase IV n=1 Tax=Terrilactibacillus tamarindi TaxID=2599694 RepID=A0A6N8CTY2_9BACI|nr:DNA polymerase IV [Terrilactibacillus tamarindi]MTT33240.1 DNA polymerase IV [Terrilactibacillus tamarindi]